MNTATIYVNEYLRPSGKRTSGYVNVAPEFADIARAFDVEISVELLSTGQAAVYVWPRLLDPVQESGERIGIADQDPDETLASACTRTICVMLKALTHELAPSD